MQHPLIRSTLDTIAPWRLRKHRLLRRYGDQARDAKKWREASELYTQYLELVPSNAPIWVQLGNVCKEHGDFAKAEAAYLTALAIMPKDADVWLQLGHLHKLQGRRGDSVESYATSLDLRPNADAYGELIGMGEILVANQALDNSNYRLPPGTYFQVNDLLFYLIHHKTPSGIQRVQLSIIDYINGLGQPTSETYKFVTSDIKGDRLFLLEREKLQAVVDYVARPYVEHSVLRDLIDAVFAATTPLVLGPGDKFIILGSFWGHGGSSDLLRALKRRTVKIGIYFYDLIPITHPEFCDDRLSDDFTQAFVEAACYVDFGFSISDFTQKELGRLLDLNGLQPIPIKTVSLAHGLGDGRSVPAGSDVQWSDAIREFKGTRYVLFVSTIEARKNHRCLFDIWKRLMNEGIDVPALLFVGRKGWRVDDLYAQLEATNYLDGKIEILHDLSDEELRCLYGNCLFTAFPSFVEGWGLPVGESLSYGKLCVTSRESSMPEVAGALSPYIDPLNSREALDVFRRLLTSGAEITMWEAKIAAGFHPRSWVDVSRDFLSAASSMIAALPDPPAPAFVPRLASGEIFFAGRTEANFDKISCDMVDRTKRLMLLNYWGLAEGQGTPMSGAEGGILVRTDVAAGQAVRGILRILASDTLHDGTLAIHHTDEPAQRHPLSAGTEHVIFFNARTDERGDLRVRLCLSRPKGESGQGDIMLCSFGYTVANDAVAWAALLENAIQVKSGRMSRKNSKRHVPA